MSNEKWSEWIEWSGGECPLPANTITGVRLRGLDRPHPIVKEASKWSWNQHGYSSDITAYRYRLADEDQGPSKAAEGMHPDLIRCAKEDWDDRYDRMCWNHIANEPEWFNSKYFEQKEGFDYYQHLQARKDLGLDGIMKRGKTEAETLALNGWKVGDILEGDEGNGPDRIIITAIGEDRFTCRWDYKCTGEYQRESGNTTLSCREWRKVGYRASVIDWQTSLTDSPEEAAALEDMVNHPPHYQSDNGIECIDAIRAALGKEGFIAYCRGNVIKYQWRLKSNPAEDQGKAAWYANKAKEALEE